MPKVKQSKSEMLANQLAEVMPLMSEANKRTAASLIAWQSRFYGLSGKQQGMAKAIIAKAMKGPDVSAKEYSLYAISDGKRIKLGYSSDVKRRLKTLQTGHHLTLRLVWKKLVGSDEFEAKKMGRKLHKRFEKYKIRGEWFSYDCFKEIWAFEI